MPRPFIFSENQIILFKAYSEINYLLDKGYPKKSSVTFVGNHYKLSKRLRYILNRATQATNDVENITRKKITDAKELKGKIFNIDLYNQFTSFQSMLDNDPLIICRDGFYRDIFSLLHSKKHLRFDIDSITRFISSFLIFEPSFLSLYIDQQRSNSRKHSHIVKEVLSKNLISGKCIVSKSVDHMLKIQTEGVTFSHDSIVLGKSQSSFDYFHWCIKNRNLGKRLTTQLINFCDSKNRNNVM